jgi:transposase
MTDITIGIDISKDHLDVYRLPKADRRRFDNTPAGHGVLIRRIGGTPTRIVYEPTGPYYRELEERLVAAARPIVKINPRHTRRFAEATRQFAKTDALDAALLARMGALLTRLHKTSLVDHRHIVRVAQPFDDVVTYVTAQRVRRPRTASQ